MLESLRLLGSRWGLPLILCALLLRIAVPAGWMPGADRGTPITICTGAGMAQAWIDGEGKVHKEGGPQQGHDQPCTYSVLGMAAHAAPDAPAVAPVRIGELLVPGAQFAAAIGQGLAAPPPPSTGPPSLI